MRLSKTELILLGVAVLLAAGGVIAPQWLVFLLTMALAKAMVVQGVVMQMRAGLVTFGQGLFFCIGGYAVGMSGHFLDITDLALLLVIGVGAAVLLAMLLGLLMTR
ncbi:branched-chain amino acid ABC transporter permease, partial [Pseudomonas sp. FSL R10-0765]|nr:branched-chain amino acid ABC transporter permease [Pseudomonas sp. FSL R10-0765]